MMIVKHSAETNVQSPIDFMSHGVLLLSPMKRGNKPMPARVTMKPTPEDWDLIQAGMAKHGSTEAGQVLRMALRYWAERVLAPQASAQAS